MLNSLWLFREIAARNCGMEQQEKVYDVETGQCPGEMIMEVKYDAFLPRVIQDMIQSDGIRQQSFSKYAACRTYG